MSQPIRRSVHQTVHNLLTLLAQQGDDRAIEALKQSDDMDIVEDDEDDQDIVRIQVSYLEGDYLVTQHGVSFMPKQEDNPSDG